MEFPIWRENKQQNGGQENNKKRRNSIPHSQSLLLLEAIYVYSILKEMSNSKQKMVLVTTVETKINS